ncbi:hypothetical protein PISMIDRAFT_115467 [Pisolithus microcarpus 441]|uniref:DUF6532 domain-containing protein n=1 Tax=Pisolithus microcarpus 441 TaxID=765257 RepID=A0A0C9YYH0_9AGAM|nr:hypothetical protein PISMIDRAFT_115467 [Pisolithus microcarpus 441]
MDVDNAGAKSGKCGRLECSWSIVVPKPTTLAFYPPLWMKLLDKAKARIWLHVATKEPSLRLETAVDGQCSEIIIKLVVKYQEDSSELEAAVKQKAAAFLEGAKFLQGECDSLGRASNFAHSALQNICLAVYYSNSVKSLHQYIEFQHFVPYKALALVTTIVHSILSIYEQHGFSKAESLNMGELEDSYQRLLVLMDTVALDMYHGPKLTAMLEDWAQTGMSVFVCGLIHVISPVLQDQVCCERSNSGEAGRLGGNLRLIFPLICVTLVYNMILAQEYDTEVVMIIFIQCGYHLTV